MKTRFLQRLSVSFVLLLIAIGSGQAQGPQTQAAMGMAFTYQGQLKQNGNPVSGTCDFQFSLWDEAAGGNQVGGTQTRGSVTVSKGLFTVLVDFGSGAFDGNARWLGLKVRCPAGSGAYTTLTPRQPVTAAPYALALPGLWTRPNSFSPSLVGGYAGNQVLDNVVGGTISGGGGPDIENVITDRFGTVSGGAGNHAGDWSDDFTDAWFATVGGGWKNRASRDNATVGGGAENTASGTSSTVGGGYLNMAVGFHATVAGGEGNHASADYATIGGGGGEDLDGNWVSDAYGTVGGGQGNWAGNGDPVLDNKPYATVGGGHWNSAKGENSTIGGGDGNQATGESSTIGGGLENTASGNDSNVAGGYDNLAEGLASAVGGGWGNGALGWAAAVGGGWGNKALANFATIAGGGPSDTEDPGTANIVIDNYGSIGGGGNNRVGSADGDANSAAFGTVGGGWDNEAGGLYATVAGGWGNYALGIGSTVGGGGYTYGVINSFPNVAEGDYATISGGTGNTAEGIGSTVGGGSSNAALGPYATVPGGFENTARGKGSFAAGQGTEAGADGCFVWGDNSPGPVSCNSANRWVARASGGVYFYTNAGLTSGVRVSAGGNAWSSVSDRNLKENFTKVDGVDVLRRLANMPISAWKYKSEDASIRHMGPMAQDFYAAFGLGEDDVSISTIDADGVALAAIQGLYAENTALRQQVSDLESRVAALEAIVAQLAKK